MRHPRSAAPCEVEYERRNYRLGIWTFLRPGVALVLGFFWTLFRLLGRSSWSALLGAMLATVLLVLLAGDAE